MFGEIRYFTRFLPCLGWNICQTFAYFLLWRSLSTNNNLPVPFPNRFGSSFVFSPSFAPSATAFGVASKSTSALSMAMQSPDLKKGVFAAAGAAVPAILSPFAAMATEGTNEWLGVDDLRLLGVLFIVHWFILYLWYQQFKNYDEGEDFFGEIDYTGPK